jgi:hypothetical protein
MALAIFRFARWLAWQLGELERAPDCPPARITVFSSAERLGQ